MTGTRRAVVAGFAAVGTGAAALALWGALSSADDEVLPAAWRWPLAAALSVIWLFGAAAAWVALFDVDDRAERRTLTGALLLSQLAKYVPGGGVIQVTGMVAMSRGERLGAARLALGLPVMGLSVIAAGGVALAGLSVADTELAGWLRPFALVGLAAPALLWRPLMATVIDTGHRLWSRIPSSEGLPSQRAIVVSSAWTAVSLAATALAYAVLAESFAGDHDVVSLALVFSVAWVAGFLVLPVPGGLGVREVVLVALIGGSGASIVGASLAHRVITIAVELVSVGLHAAAGRHSRDSPS